MTLSTIASLIKCDFCTTVH